MEKQAAIRKINQIGKAGYIISVIVQVLVIIALVGALIGGAVMAAFPKEAITMTMSGSMDVDLNLNRLGGAHLTDTQLQNLQSELQSGSASFSIDDRDYLVTGVETTQDGVRVSAETSNITADLKTILWPTVVSGVVYIVVVLITIHFIKRLCKEIKNCESPFSEGVIRKIKQLAYALIPWVFISGITESIMSSGMTGRTSVDLNIDLGRVMVVLVVLALAYIFQYGAVLQQESDETL